MAQQLSSLLQRRAPAQQQQQLPPELHQQTAANPMLLRNKLMAPGVSSAVAGAGAALEHLKRSAGAPGRWRKQREPRRRR